MRALGDYLQVKCHACVGGTSVREDTRVLQGEFSVFGSLSLFLVDVSSCSFTASLLLRKRKRGDFFLTIIRNK